MRWLLRILFLLLAVVLIVRWVGRALAALFGKGERGSVPQTPDSRMQRDPVCGTYVAPEISIREVSQGKTLYFCSERCREQYRASERSLAAGSGT
ncbi:MAG: YHS domain-containing protein [Acidobacteria bacterium]|nr:YHS domain-containing protein [Acidobacteriota bacterium]